MPTLYLVTATVTALVIADDWDGALSLGRHAIQEETREDNFEMDGPDEVERVEDLPDGAAESLPHNALTGPEADEERTCAEWIKSIQSMP